MRTAKHREPERIDLRQKQGSAFNETAFNRSRAASVLMLGLLFLSVAVAPAVGAALIGGALPTFALTAARVFAFGLFIAGVSLVHRIATEDFTGSQTSRRDLHNEARALHAGNDVSFPSPLSAQMQLHFGPGKTPSLRSAPSAHRVRKHQRKIG